MVGLPPSLQIGGRMGNQNFSIMMQGMNTDELYEWAPKLQAAIEQPVAVYTYMAQLQSWMKSRQHARTLTPLTAGK